MFVPDGVDLTREEKLEMAKQKQEIEYSNTRLNHMPFDEQSNKNTAQVKFITIPDLHISIFRVANKSIEHFFAGQTDRWHRHRWERAEQQFSDAHYSWI